MSEGKKNVTNVERLYQKQIFMKKKHWKWSSK